VIKSEEIGRELSGLVVPRIGRLVATGEEWEPYRLLDSDGTAVEPVSVFLRELLAAWLRRFRPTPLVGEF
jgi:hypothetical protein